MTEQTVHDRIALAGATMTPAQTAALVALLAGLGIALLFLQAPAVHDQAHDFRHVAGVVCH